jgi:hypothetical protein
LILISLSGRSRSPIPANTTSLTLGHAMKARDRDKAFGFLLNKALRAAGYLLG